MTIARRPSKRIECRWYITQYAAREYAALVKPRRIDLEQATEELIELSREAHHVRDQDNGLALWRVKAGGQRIRLLVGRPDGVSGVGAAQALIRVLPEHGRATRGRHG